MTRKSSLGKILRGISEKSTGDKKVSIVEAINKACTDGVTTSGAFSFLAVKRKLKECLSILEKDEYSRDDFFL